MKRSSHQAFTLIELLVVITVIAVIAGIALPIFNSIQTTARRTQSMSNLRQWSTAALAYASDNDGALPGQGDAQSWAAGATGTTDENAAWYNALPRAYANSMNFSEYATNPALFYTKASLFYVPAAKYPSTKLQTPQWAVAFNSKLNTSTVSARLSLIKLPAQTALFLECGLTGETTVVPAQTAYTAAKNYSYAYASRAVARYNGEMIVTFLDGHAGVFLGTTVVQAGTGKAYFTAYPAAFPTGAADIYWEADPTVSPN